jgi:hypothetical protein
MLLKKFTWLLVLLASLLVLLWRLIDFAIEAVRHDFHMSRFGLALRGTSAGALQLVIILFLAALVLSASIGLVRSCPKNTRR